MSCTEHIFSYYMLRHKSTGKLLPAQRRGRGSTSWDPAVKRNIDMDYPRLFTRAATARRVLQNWERGELINSYSRDEDYKPRWVEKPERKGQLEVVLGNLCVSLPEAL